MLITDRLVVDGGWIERADVTSSITIGLPGSHWVTPPKPVRGSTMCARSIPTTPTIS